MSNAKKGPQAHVVVIDVSPNVCFGNEIRRPRHSQLTKRGKQTLEKLHKEYPPGIQRRRLIHGEWCEDKGE